MAYNHGKEERKWKHWKASEEKTMRQLGVDDEVIELLRIEDRVAFNSDRRFYEKLQEVGIYLDEIAESEQQTEIKTLRISLTALRMIGCIKYYSRRTGLIYKSSL